MDENTDSALHYGHLGRPVYLPDAKAWTFTRSLARVPSIVYTGVTKTKVPSPFYTETRPTPRVPEKDAGKLIASSHPELAASWSSFRQEPFSKAVINTTEQYDPEVSSLFDLGYAVDLRRHDKKLRSVPIAVAVSGECRNIMTFRTIEEETLHLAMEDSTMRVPSIDDTETSEWSKCGAPIRQVHFARPLEEKPFFMAARLPTSTTIFRPLYHWDPVHMYFPADVMMRSSKPLQNSRLDANPVVEISISETGGFSHADVTFNPWYQRQFGIVDVKGNWHVWEITGRQRLKKATWSAMPVRQGSLPLLNHKSKLRRPQLDGWSCIEWIGDVGTILVANRHNIMIYSIVDAQIPPRTVELGMSKQSEWVLAVQRNPRNPSQFFVLTTTRILWFDAGVLPGEEQTGPSLYPRLSWKHFRDPEDTTLRFSDLVVYQDLYLVLFSQLTQVVQIFPCPFIADEQTESLSVSDPLILDAPLLADIPSVQHDSNVKFSSFIFKEVAHSAALSKNYYYNPHLTVIKLFWMDSNLAVHESTFKGPQGDPDELDFHREDNILRLRKRYAPTKLVRVDDSFIVDDWDESVAPQKTVHRHKSKKAPTRTGSDLQWTLDFSSIYDMATGKAEIIQTKLKQKERPKPKPRTVDELIASLQSDMENLSTKQTPSQTLVEMSGNRILGDDLDQSADDVKRLVSELIPEIQDPDAKCRIMTLPLRFSKELQGAPVIPSGDAGIELLQTYDRLVDDWMSSLSHHIPPHTRIMKEKVIRGIAADLLLARLVHISNTLDDVTQPDPVGRNENAEAQNKFLHSSYLPSSQIPASQAPMLTNAFGFQRNPGPVTQSKYAAAPPLSGLSAFTTFKTPRAIPRNVTNLLSHWSVGNNPSRYAWERIEDEETRRASRANTPRNRRKRRSRTRDLSLPPTPAVPTVRAWGSQPDGPPRINLTSSQPMEGVSMTQTERGVFGARDPFKKPKLRKKKRAAGF
ncbi:hypothetical protein N7499_000155 [Penicillium canescens]|uniref:RNA polymerase I-specific transcription initiation factor RRN6-like protein n=1 Tax=Penicillium canescens TaxID=5083 RepID=A0AAD6NAX3_PENCN|nr:uncharacterized protein N7446_011644 [Penicillium canescens]KAJ6029014.1 hypothetical protein N7444_012001 [Penicillium canescens]KAJ6047447.1 hypothetical protein N7460_003594 [Penicillium canescens]KAJ6048961.1 hypothetical protein N7446_011644 [Penicillium canescens]KAJ6100525.1 hypothetical protein N7499_000155 [Penicillium canescens]KAJ6172989.1 hypothetical protein N7485_005801 [Penicillium canescens]